MTEYVIGIDGGGTKTRGVLFDNQGMIIAEATEGPSNIMANEALAKQNITKTLDQLMKHVGSNPVSHIQLGLAGASRYLYWKDLIDGLKQKYHAGSVGLCSDVEMALHALDTNHSAILAVSGTGSAIMAKDDEKLFMVGGYGHLLSDEGSAYHLAIEGFKAIIENENQGLPISSFGWAILESIGAKDVESIKTFVYSKDKTDIAFLSKTISLLAEAGNETAKRLLENEGSLLAEQVITAYQRLRQKNDVVIAVTGGFITQAPFVRKSFMTRLHASIPDVFILDHAPDATIGAYRLAKRNRGGTIR